MTEDHLPEDAFRAIILRALDEAAQVPVSHAAYLAGLRKMIRCIEAVLDATQWWDEADEDNDRPE